MIGTIQEIRYSFWENPPRVRTPDKLELHFNMQGTPLAVFTGCKVSPERNRKVDGKMRYNALTTIAVNLGLLAEQEVQALSTEAEVYHCSKRVCDALKSYVERPVRFSANRLKSGRLVPDVDSIQQL